MIRHTLWAGWWTLVLGMVLALLLTALRFGFPLLGEYREPLSERLSQAFGVPVAIESLETRWNGPFPQFELKGIEATAGVDARAEVSFKFERLQLELNWWDSILARAPIFQRVDASGLFVRWYQRDGRWLHLPGSGTEKAVDLNALAATLDIVLAQPEFVLIDSQLELIPEQGTPQQINLAEILFENSATEHQLSGQFSLPLLGADTDLEFAAQLKGDPAEPDSLELPFYLQLNNLGPELLTLAAQELPISALSASAEVWGSVNQFGLRSLRGRLGVERSKVTLNGSDIELVDSSTEFSLKPDTEGYQLLLRDTRLGDALGQIDFSPSQFEFHRVAGELKFARFLLESVDLALLDDLLARYPLPEKIQTIIASLSPKGSLSDLRVDLSDTERGPFVRANLQAVSLSSWRNTPAVSNLSAQLEVDSKAGQLDIDSRAMSLSFPTIYSYPQTYELAQGRLNWVNQGEALLLNSGPLQLVHEQFAADGKFSLHLPFDRQQQAYLNLMIGLQGAQAEAAAILTPDLLRGTDKVSAWLTSAIGSGEVNQAGLVVHAPTRALEDRPAPSVELFVAGEGIGLDYQAPWPAITQASAFIHMHQGDLRVDITEAQVQNSKMLRSVSLKPQGRSELRVWGQVEGDLTQVDQLLHAEPLESTAGRTLDDWKLSGEHRSLIRLNIALDKSYTPKVQVAAKVKQGGFTSEKQRISFSDIAGEIRFDTASGLSGENLQVRFLDRPATVSITRSEQRTTDVRFSGRWDVTELLDWGRIPLTAFATGEIPLSGRLRLCSAQQCRSTLTLESNLLGTEVKAPAYFALDAETSSRLSVELALGSPLLLAVNYADRLRTSMQLGDSLKAHFSLGGESARLPKASGFKVDGRIPQLELAELFSLIGDLNASFNQQGGGSLPLDLNLAVDALTIGPLVLDEVRAELAQLGSEMQVQLSGPKVDGLISWSKEQPAYRVALDKMHIRVPETEPTEVLEAEPEPERTSQALFDAVPAVDFDVADLRWNRASLGRWRGSLRHIGHSIELSSIRGEMQDMELSGNATWILAEPELTQLNLAYQGKDLGNTLVSLDEARLIETESLQGRLALAWEAAPWQVAGRYMYGNLKFNTGKGRLLEGSGGSGLLRLLGILNFNNLARRLQLDFSDLFAKGVVFDSLSGDFLVEDGLARALQPMEMKGPSAGMLATGAINLGDKSLDMQVNVSLPLVSNTPLAAVLLGAPQVAGALFLIDKLIGDKIEKATAIAYTLRGGWDAPELKLLNSANKSSDQ